VDLEGPDFSCRAVHVPSKTEVVSLKGNRHRLSEGLSELVLAGRPCLVEAVLCDDVPFSSLREDLESIVDGSSVELLRVKDGTGINGNWSFDVSGGLESMTEEDVFLRRLEGVPLEQDVRDSYVAMFREVLQDILDQDGDETTS
jgi:exonuclease SbcD